MKAGVTKLATINLLVPTAVPHVIHSLLKLAHGDEEVGVSEWILCVISEKFAFRSPADHTLKLRHVVAARKRVYDQSK